MFTIICYDIPSDRTRNEVSRILKGFGYRVQESVFECELTPVEYKKLKLRITKKIDSDVDSIRYYTLCAPCMNRIEVCGLGDIKRQGPYFIV